MKSEPGLAVSYLRKGDGRELYVGVPCGRTSRVHLADDAAKGRFVTALLKARLMPPPAPLLRVSE